jgi:hypothetical protein
MRTKPQAPLSLPDDANTLSVHFYLSDIGNAPRVAFTFPNGQTFDHALSEYSTVSGPQKLALRSTLLALRDETFTLEGFT